MKIFNWNEDKNKELIKVRNVSFENIIDDISNNKLLEVINHPNKKKYPHQKVFVINHDDYIYLVPFVENEKEYFLKTIFPSRKAQKRYGEK
jgi:uncharacterized DUF497 family protein